MQNLKHFLETFDEITSIAKLAQTSSDMTCEFFCLERSIDGNIQYQQPLPDVINLLIDGIAEIMFTVKNLIYNINSLDAKKNLKLGVRGGGSIALWLAYLLMDLWTQLPWV